MANELIESFKRINYLLNTCEIDEKTKRRIRACIPREVLPEKDKGPYYGSGIREIKLQENEDEYYSGMGPLFTEDSEVNKYYLKYHPDHLLSGVDFFRHYLEPGEYIDAEARLLQQIKDGFPDLYELWETFEFPSSLEGIEKIEERDKRKVTLKSIEEMEKRRKKRSKFFGLF